MLGKLSGWDDTIVALATPHGVGALGVIRLSGPRAITIANDLFHSKDLEKQPSHTLHVGWLKDGDQRLDEAVVSLFKAPHSYTGEDVVEFSCHGSAFIHQQIIDACGAGGARLAKAGEFTQRAFLKGKLDLTQAEAVADLIASNTEASHQTALHNIRGGFSKVLQELREKLIRFSALMELELDFSMEDVEFADRTKFDELIRETQDTTKQLLHSFKLGNVIRNGVSVAIVGKPNAGKSTLLNTLLNENRAIVSEIAGTTRDTIEELINIDGILFRLIDTAGLRESTDTIELIGVERSREKMKQADIVVYMFDCNTETNTDLNEAIESLNGLNGSYMLVGNKVDLLGEEAAKKRFNGHPALFLSAKTHEHVNDLKKELTQTVVEGSVNTENTIITNARHYAALQEVEKSLEDVRAGLDEKIPTDLLALHVRHALHYLGEITGEITNEDRLDFIFSKFCIGK
jgi:tRNA modification GTPase